MRLYDEQRKEPEELQIMSSTAFVIENSHSSEYDYFPRKTVFNYGARRSPTKKVGQSISCLFKRVSGKTTTYTQENFPSCMKLETMCIHVGSLKNSF